MLKKIILVLLVCFFLSSQVVFAEETVTPKVVPTTSAGPEVNPCRKAWNDRMARYEHEYQNNLDDVLNQRKKTSVIINSGILGRNLRSYDCKIRQICELVELSYNPTLSIDEQEVVGQAFRCEPVKVAELGGYITECNKNNLANFSKNSFLSLSILCKEQVAQRVSRSTIQTETRVVEDTEIKKTSNLVGYLMKFNKKLDGLMMDMGDMIGILFDVTRKMTCVHPDGQ